MKRLLTFIVSITFASPGLADEVDIPNSFTAGTRAVAADVNANFDAVEVAVDDNAQRIVLLESALSQSGVAVRVDGAYVGRFLEAKPGSIEVDVAAAAGGGTANVAPSGGLGTARLLHLVSPTGYTFLIASSDTGSNRVDEGELDFRFLAFDGANCSGNMWYPIEGDSGLLSTFTPNVGDRYPMKPWIARQGFVFSSPDPADPNVAYMLRRGAAVQTAPITTLLVWAPGLAAPFCLDLNNNPAYDPNDPLDVNHSVVPIEVWDATETGIPGMLGGEVTIGM